MFREISLKTAIFVSLSLHLFAFSSGSLFHLGKSEPEEKEIEVTYIVEEASKKKVEKVIRSLPRKYDLEKKPIQEPQKKKAETVTPKKIVPVKAAAKKIFPKEEEESVKKLEEYIAYYDLIRERIKVYVTRHYKKLAEEGSVEVIFLLGNDGKLKKIHVDEINSSRSRYLHNVALESVKSASPFPSFPKILNKKELTFSIAIIFQKE
ncbi:MAG: TonB family protein [Candidatus Omnitrophica bacterium]|nr:TonB family protein [Candidatus Omnitrophota bacterium]